MYVNTVGHYCARCPIHFRGDVAATEMRSTSALLRMSRFPASLSWLVFFEMSDGKSLALAELVGAWKMARGVELLPSVPTIKSPFLPLQRMWKTFLSVLTCPCWQVFLVPFLSRMQFSACLHCSTLRGCSTLVLTFVAKIRSYCFTACYDSRKEKMESLFTQRITEGDWCFGFTDVARFHCFCCISFSVGEKWGNHELCII